MKPYKIITSIIGLSLVVSSCSSVKITGETQFEGYENLNDKTVMVMTRTTDNTIRYSLEQELVKQLEEKQIESVESYKTFPELNPEHNLSQQQIDVLKKELTDQGIDVLLVTQLKGTEEYTSTSGTQGVYYVSPGPVVYYRGYRNWRYMPSGHYTIGEVETETKTNTKYILETTIYTLDVSKEQQLVGVVNTVIDNPGNLNKVVEDFSKKLTNSLVD